VEFLLPAVHSAIPGTATTWAVNELSHSTLLLSMMSTFSSLPFFLFTLPAGALADMVDRAKLVRITHVWLAASAASLAILGWSHLLNGNLILLFVFLIGAAFAFNAPAFSSLLTDIVSDEELASASVLSGLQLDIAGMIGPALGGALTPLIGTNTIFAANGACFLLINLALMRWRQPKGNPTLPWKISSNRLRRRPLRALHARDAGYFGATGIVLSAGRSYSSATTGDRLKRIAP
jgi:MFS family permease